MYLKSLEIQGFKSFAEKTVFEFSPAKNGHHSVTAIIGPNGSGKSNVSDAIRWVMGEQSMKTLRGKKSEDIIFSGSEHKGQLGMASVSMHLDNTDGRIPVEYQEVVIGRRLYRTGESEYLLNGNILRLLDLQLLLAKAQFGHGSYSVVGQGMIDRMLLQSPAERKDFFDEAVGIKEFQIKRHQAMLKLNRSQEHIGKAQLLLTEISPRLRSLSRQVTKLEQRQEVEVALRELQEQYYVTLWQHHDKKLKEIDARLVVQNSAYTKTTKTLFFVQQELSNLAHEASRTEQFGVLQKEYQDMLRKKTSLERDRAVLQGKLETEYAKAGKQNVAWLEGKTAELTSQLGTVDTELTTHEAGVEVLSAKVLEAKKKVDDLSILRTELRGSLVSAQQHAVERAHQQTTFQFSGLRAVQAILQHRTDFGRVHGLVAQLGVVEEQYRLALDLAAGGHLTSLVVGDDAVASACVQYLRRERLGVATFLPMNKIQQRFVPNNIDMFLQEQGVHGLAIDLVRFDRKYADIFSYALGSTLVVEDMEIARKIGVGRIRMVTLDGDVLEKSGSIKGGYRKKRTDGVSFGDESFGQDVGDDVRVRAEVLQKELDQTEMAYEHALEQVRSLQSQTQIAVSKSDMLGSKKREIEQELARFDQERSLSTMSKDEYTQAMQDVSKQKHVFDTYIKEAEKNLVRAQENIEQFNTQEEQKKQRVFTLQDEMQDVQAILNQLVDERNTQKIELARLEQKQEDLEHEAYKELSQSVARIAGRKNEFLDHNALERVQAEIQKLKYKLTLIGGIDEEVVTEYEETKIRHDDLSGQLNDVTKTIADLETLIAELDVLMKKRRAKAFKEIRKEFGRYFKILFEGGNADLVEVYGFDDNEQRISTGHPSAGTTNNEQDEEINEEIEEAEIEGEVLSEVGKKKRRKKMLTGIEVRAQPPGKKIKYLQTLSGGERTMTSIALVCAILHTNPSPFVVLDEVEAALDEANSQRLTNIISELSKQSQFILITHNRVTMHVADALYGVTMGNDGVSKLVCVNFDEMQTSD